MIPSNYCPNSNIYLPVEIQVFVNYELFIMNKVNLSPKCILMTPKFRIISKNNF